MLDHELRAAIEAYSDEHASSGQLHVIIEDCNVERYWLRTIGERQRKAGDVAGAAICEALAARSLEDRIRILGFPDWYTENTAGVLEADREPCPVCGARLVQRS